MPTKFENPVLLPRVGNVSGEADAAFMAELNRKDRHRYDRLIDAIKKAGLQVQEVRKWVCKAMSTQGLFLPFSSSGVVQAEKAVSERKSPAIAKCDILPSAQPIRQNRNKYMSKRFQEGYVFQSGKMWHGRYRRDVVGQEKRESPLVVLGVRGPMTKLQARQKLLEIINAQGLNDHSYLEKLTVPVKTFNDVVDVWEQKRLPQLAPSTQDAAPGEIRKHLRPFLGGLPFDAIGTAIVNDWITVMVKSGLEPKTVENKYKYFTQIMNWYARQNDQPKRTWYPDLPPIPDKEARWYTQEEMIQIIDASADYPALGQVKGQYKPLFRLDAFGGFRSGEVTGLIVEDLDFENGIVHVKRSIYRGREVPTKGKKNRKVFVDSITMQMVKNFLGGRTTGRVFQSRTGAPIWNCQLNTVLTDVTARLGLKRGTMHAFRHGRISLLTACGVHGKIIREQVGHQNQRTTDKYTHAEMNTIRDTMDRLAFSCTQKPNVHTMTAGASNT